MASSTAHGAVQTKATQRRRQSHKKLKHNRTKKKPKGCGNEAKIETIKLGTSVMANLTDQGAGDMRKLGTSMAKRN